MNMLFLVNSIIIKYIEMNHMKSKRESAHMQDRSRVGCLERERNSGGFWNLSILWQIDCDLPNDCSFCRSLVQNL